MKITYKTHDNLEINSGQISILGTNSLTVYTDIIQGLQDENEKISIVDENYSALEIAHVIDWIGDVGTQNLVLTKYLRQIEKLFLQSVTDEQQNKIHDEINRIFNIVSEQLFLLDLPIEVNFDFDLKKLFKYCGIRFDPILISKPYGIIETIIKIHETSNLDSCIALTNVAHYLTSVEFEELSQLVKETNQKILLIEFTEIEEQNFYGNAEFYYIDTDFIDWHN
ncbi:type II-A CRISPR-associated protein Csn2 [Pediococcus pentosaceus]|uniref:type II-A CRISPR-associated protein Csn2 n=1 Tax=Pediococcus pentosaceus TaxID=1255 RepID=UPI0018FF0EDC|nr:type II-A CRISPR-associated protein Csn2 [Pediococcus pentosaceus]MBF7121858.1 type II-A CRISPR-associated protein Csn2 [Pediococcus pentosaceus]